MLKTIKNQVKSLINSKLLNKTKLKKEFEKLVKLEEKRLKLENEYDSIPIEISGTQKDILRNNLKMIAKTADLEGVFLNTKKDYIHNKWFNIQGTKPQIIQVEDLYLRNQLSINTELYAACTEDLILLEEKILYNNFKISNKKNNLIKKFTEKKLIKKITKFSNIFKGNEQLVKEFVFSGLTGEDDHWHNFQEMKFRLNFICLLIHLDLSLKNSEEIDIDTKKPIYIDINKQYDTIIDFLSRFKQNKYDFIVKPPL